MAGFMRAHFRAALARSINRPAGSVAAPIPGAEISNARGSDRRVGETTPLATAGGRRFIDLQIGGHIDVERLEILGDALPKISDG
jgi:hypothetical protein